MILIDYDYAMKRLKAKGIELLPDVRSEILNCQPVDAVMIKHGKWLDAHALVYDESMSVIARYSICSNCNNMIIESTEYNNEVCKYCSNCGAKMDGGD